MKKIQVKVLRRILLNEKKKRGSLLYSESALRADREFRNKYVLEGEWNSKATKIIEEYNGFYSNLSKFIPFRHYENRGQDNGTLRITFTLNEDGTGETYGTKFDLERTFIYGFPKEFRNLILKELVFKMDYLKEIQLGVKVNANKEKPILITLNITEGCKRRTVNNIVVYKKGALNGMSCKKDGMELFGSNITSTLPEHIPAVQEYLWLAKHYAIKENFEYYAREIYLKNISCCSNKLTQLNTLSEVNFCPSCGTNIKEKFKDITFQDFEHTESQGKILHIDEVLKIENVPYEYVTTKRIRASKVPIF